MPELAEVEYFRRQWNAAIGHRVLRVCLHSRKRIFRSTDTDALRRHLPGARLLSSVARGKRMLFRFSNENWLGIHLGMTGRLETAGPDFQPGKHDHLVLFQRQRALVLRDSRQFGRVQFHHGKTPPAWWNETVPEIAELSRAFFDAFLLRHCKAPVKAVLLLQSGFSGIGNWMADEILWRAKVAPAARSAELSKEQRGELFRATRFVARESLRIIGENDSELPRGWLIHQRWRRDGKCPRHGVVLRRETIGGRTTAWCPKCQRCHPEPHRGRGTSQNAKARNNSRGPSLRSG